MSRSFATGQHGFQALLSAYQPSMSHSFSSPFSLAEAGLFSDIHPCTDRFHFVYTPEGLFIWFFSGNDILFLLTTWEAGLPFSASSVRRNYLLYLFNFNLILLQRPDFKSDWSLKHCKSSLLNTWEKLSVKEPSQLKAELEQSPSSLQIFFLYTTKLILRNKAHLPPPPF